MALLSTRGVYGLMSIYEISKGDRQNPVSLSDISEAINVSKNYLEQVLNALRTAGIVSALRGKQGGYFLIKSLDEITFYDVFILLENDFILANPKNISQDQYSIFFKDYNDKLKELFSKPLSSFGDYEKEAKKYLNYMI